jgi:hypothetical protein
MGIARLHVFPGALTGMIAAPGGHDVEGPVTAEAKLGEWSRQIGPTPGDEPQAGHVLVVAGSRRVRWQRMPLMGPKGPGRWRSSQPSTRATLSPACSSTAGNQSSRVALISVLLGGPDRRLDAARGGR